MTNYYDGPLVELKIEVSYRCELACVHCSSDARPDNDTEMTIEACEEIVRSGARLGMRETVFSGGEPLLWPPILSVVELAADAGAQVTVYTSGYVDSVHSALRALSDAGARRIACSVFGASASEHEAVTRVAGSFERTKAALGEAKELGLATHIHFVPLASNVHTVPAVCRLGRQLSVDGVSLLRFVPQGRGSLIRSETLGRSDAARLRRDIRALRDAGFPLRTGSPLNYLLVNEHPQCNSGIDRLIVRPDLTIHPCDAFKQMDAVAVVGTEQFSNLRDSTLEECWRLSPYLGAVRSFVRQPPAEPCKSCIHYALCKSGCAAQKFIEHGTLRPGPDPLCLIDSEG